MFALVVTPYDQPDHFSGTANGAFSRSESVRDSAIHNSQSKARLLDYSVQSKLLELVNEFKADGKRLAVTGLDNHIPLSSHPQAARKQLRPVLVPTSSLS